MEAANQMANLLERENELLREEVARLKAANSGLRLDLAEVRWELIIFGDWIEEMLGVGRFLRRLGRYWGR